ncbi:putative membrane protein YdjX (TVP38/TMEM64 family) [Metabacillus malikii]|uniref:TVP38/TMEM64 family membrane protein n=1 Tax=Metabacillus malikii TaxID=1504265 RepID=A0ABT9ZFG0_9BACI|nr:putative membrane protein YdjX (TVP38/TMEM64 family) [Metabacillus malikii]
MRTIELATSSVVSAIQTTGFFAPIVFILFHLIRQFLFIPVAVVCIVGGVLFGGELGSIYSLIGLTGSSILFYSMTKLLPSFYERLVNMKEKYIGAYTNISFGQIIILRLIPFMNFSLICFCILEKAKSFKRYVKLSLVTHIPSCICFTFLGAFLQKLSPLFLGSLMIILFILVYVLREKQAFIKWDDFFVKQKG